MAVHPTAVSRRCDSARHTKNAYGVFCAEGSGPDPYGNLVDYTYDASVEDNPFRFSTKFWTAEIGLYDYGHRHYSPPLGRWLSRDPVGEQGGGNSHLFVENAPLLDVDPLGDETTGRGAQGRCEKVKKEFESEHGAVIKEMQTKGCLAAEKPLRCEKCEGGGQYGGVISVCYWRGEEYSEEWFRTTFAHELQHASGHCSGDPPAGQDTCEQRICSEYKAYFCGGILGRNEVPEDVYTKARKDAIDSSLIYCCSKKFVGIGKIGTPAQEAKLRQAIGEYLDKNCTKPTAADCWFTPRATDSRVSIQPGPSGGSAPPTPCGGVCRSARASESL